MTYLQGMSVSFVARRHGIGSNQFFIWRRLMAQGALTAAPVGEEVVPASEYRALEAQVRELHRLLGKKAMENELLREAVARAAYPKKLLLRSTSLPQDGYRPTARLVRHYNRVHLHRSLRYLSLIHI